MGSSSWSWLASLGVESLPYSELGWVIRPQCSQLAVGGGRLGPFSYACLE